MEAATTGRSRVLYRRRPHLFRQSCGTSGSWGPSCPSAWSIGNGLPLTSTTRLSYIVDLIRLTIRKRPVWRQDDGADAQDSGVSISPDSSDGAIVIGRDGWYRFNADVTGLNTDYGKLCVSPLTPANAPFDLDLVQFMDAD